MSRRTTARLLVTILTLAGIGMIVGSFDYNDFAIYLSIHQTPRIH